MPDATGILAKMGIKDVAGWATAYAAVDELIPFISESVVQGFTRIPDESLVGTAGRAPSDQGVQSLAGQTVHKMDYNNFDTLLETAFGAVAGRVFTLTDDELAKYLWLEFEKSTSRWRCGAAKIAKIVIAGEKDGHVTMTIDWLARDIARVATAFPGISTPGTRALIRFEDLRFDIDTIAAGPPTSADALQLESFELELDRVLVEDDYASKDTAGAAVKFPLEPIPNGFRVNSLKVKVPRYSTDTKFVTWKDSDTPIQAKMTFTRSAETMVIELPDMRVTEGFDPPVGGPERLQNEGTLDCYMPESTNPLYTGGEVRLTMT